MAKKNGGKRKSVAPIKKPFKSASLPFKKGGGRHTHFKGSKK